MAKKTPEVDELFDRLEEAEDAEDWALFDQIASRISGILVSARERAKNKQEKPADAAPAKRPPDA